MDAWGVEQSRLFARAMRGHPTIKCFEDSHGMFPYQSLDALYSALATLPALESIALGGPEVMQANEYLLANPESLAELLRVPSLRSVCFSNFYFTRALCQAAANALIEGTAFTNLEFWSCSFSAAECAEMMANGLGRNTSVKFINVRCNNAPALFGALAAALPSNSTLQHLEWGDSSSGRYRRARRTLVANVFSFGKE